MKKGKIRCLSLSAALIGVFIVSLAFPAYAADYGEVYPSYVKQSGGSFIECQTNLGRGAIVIPVTYQSGYIGFSGSGYNVMNISNSSISGQFVLQNGTAYTCRASGFSTFQYYTDGSWGQYVDLTVSEIYNTNVQFTDEKGDRANTITVFKPYEIAVVSLGILSVLLLLVLLLKRL